MTSHPPYGHEVRHDLYLCGGQCFHDTIVSHSSSPTTRFCCRPDVGYDTIVSHDDAKGGEAMSEWEIHVHIEDEETARNMMDELNGEGFGVTLLKREVRERATMDIQYYLMPPKQRVEDVEA